MLYAFGCNLQSAGCESVDDAAAVWCDGHRRGDSALWLREGGASDMFLRNHWYIAAMAHEVGRQPLARWLLNEPVVMYRTEAGRAIALLDICPHRSYALSKGELTGDNLRCNYHGLVFGPEGQCVKIPGQVNIPPRCKVRAFPLIERWQWLWIWMGDPALADEALLPDMHWNDAPGWTTTGGYFELKCHYQLLVDNLMDLSHEATVHPGTIGNAAVAETPCKTEVNNTHVRTVRFIENCQPPPLFVKLRGFAENIDRTQDINFYPPSHIVIKSKAVPHGSDPERTNMALEYRVLNGITPATDRTTHHFWAVPRSFAHEEAITKAFHDGSVKTFMEDIGVLEGQQARIDHQGGNPKWIDVNADSGAVAARRIVQRLMSAEHGAA
jgi:phenylpropionate dioxygenase-like ring-hydroxylating dioxygenase large terminal subunit